MSRGAARRPQHTVKPATSRNQSSHPMDNTDSLNSRKRKCSSDDEDPAAKVKHQHNLSLANRILLRYTNTREDVDVEDLKERQEEKASESNDPLMQHHTQKRPITTAEQLLSPPLREGTGPPLQRDVADGGAAAHLNSAFFNSLLHEQQGSHRQTYQPQDPAQYSQLQQSLQALIRGTGVQPSLPSTSFPPQILRHQLIQQEAAARTARSNTAASDAIRALLGSSAVQLSEASPDGGPSPSAPPAAAPSAGIEKIPSSSSAQVSSRDDGSPKGKEADGRSNRTEEVQAVGCDSQAGLRMLNQQGLSLFGNRVVLPEIAQNHGREGAQPHSTVNPTLGHIFDHSRNETQLSAATDTAKLLQGLSSVKTATKNQAEARNQDDQNNHRSKDNQGLKMDHYSEAATSVVGMSSSSSRLERRNSVSQHRDTMLTEDQQLPSSQGNKSRQERKKLREKQRRNDLNKGFGDLKEVMFRIDPSLKTEGVGGPEDADENRAAAISRRRASMSIGLGGDDDCGDGDPSSLNRVELLRRAVLMLDRIHVENEARKSLVARLGLKLTDTERTLHQLVQSISRESAPQRGLGGSSSIGIVRSQAQLPIRPLQHSIVPSQMTPELLSGERTPIPGATGLSLGNVSSSVGLRRPSLPANAMTSFHSDPNGGAGVGQQSRPLVPQADLTVAQTALQSIASLLRTDTSSARNPVSNEESAHLLSLAQTAERQQIDAREVVRSSTLSNADEGKSDREEGKDQSKGC